MLKQKYTWTEKRLLKYYHNGTNLLHIYNAMVNGDI